MGLVRTNVSGEFEIKGATTIDVVTAKALHDRAVAFVDVGEQFAIGHIPQAHALVYPSDFDEVRLLELVDKTQEIVIYSDIGGQQDRYAANMAARALARGLGTQSNGV